MPWKYLAKQRTHHDSGIAIRTWGSSEGAPRGLDYHRPEPTIFLPSRDQLPSSPGHDCGPPLPPHPSSHPPVPHPVLHISTTTPCKRRTATHCSHQGEAVGCYGKQAVQAQQGGSTGSSEFKGALAGAPDPQRGLCK